MTDTQTSSFVRDTTASVCSGRSQRRHTRGYKRRAAPPLPLRYLVVALLVGLLCLAPTLASASQGDRSPEYKDCVASCTADACRDHVDDGVVKARRLPWILRMTKWTCEDDCKYHCTHMVTNDAAARVRRIRHEAEQAADAMFQAGTISMASRATQAEQMVQERLAQLRPVQKQMVQYHGKWVFVRFLGAQEPLSVIFSLLNLRVQLKALLMLRKQLPDAFPLKLVYIIHTLISINAWLWSAMFHTRDKNLTEKLDYYSAAAFILSGFFFSACRLFRLSPGTAGFRTLQRACIVALALHVIYLSIGRFDYAYNMTANVCVGLAHNVLWLIYSFRPSTFPSNVIADRSAASRAALRASKPPSALATPDRSSTPPVPVVTNIGPPSSSIRVRRRLQLLIGLMTAAALLEVLDFPPILRFLDTHSLWHLATVPISEMWYRWLADDARECVSTGWWLGDALQTPAMAKQAATAIGQARDWAGDKLKGRAAVLAQNMELNVLTAKLNELANRAGFSPGGVGGSGGSSVEYDGSAASREAGSSTGIELGAPSGLSEREREKARKLGERMRV